MDEFKEYQSAKKIYVISQYVSIISMLLIALACIIFCGILFLI